MIHLFGLNANKSSKETFAAHIFIMNKISIKSLTMSQRISEGRRERRVFPSDRDSNLNHCVLHQFKIVHFTSRCSSIDLSFTTRHSAFWELRACEGIVYFIDYRRWQIADLTKLAQISATPAEVYTIYFPAHRKGPAFIRKWLGHFICSCKIFIFTSLPIIPNMYTRITKACM